MLVLKEGQMCTHGHNCQYNQYDGCQGANPGRETVFRCEYCVNGTIVEHGQIRNQLDQTGNMKIIME